MNLAWVFPRTGQLQRASCTVLVISLDVFGWTLHIFVTLISDCCGSGSGDPQESWYSNSDDSGTLIGISWEQAGS